MADTTRSVDILLNGRDQAAPAIDKTSNALTRLRTGLEEAKHSLRSFNSILELGFGFQIGRLFFEKVHELVLKIGEDIVESVTHTKGMAEQAKVLAESIQGVNKAKREFDELFHPTPARFEFLPNSKIVEEKLRQAEEERDRAGKALAPQEAAFAALETQRRLMRFSGQAEPPGWFESRRRDIEERFKNQRLEAENTRQAFERRQSEAEEENLRRKPIMRQLATLGSFFGLSVPAEFGQQAIQKLVRTDTSVGGVLSNLFGGVLDVVGGGAARLEFARQRDAILGEDRTERQRDTSLAAVQGRFITRGAGLDTPGVIQQKETNKRLDRIQKRLDDLGRKFGPVGVIDHF